MPRSPKSCDESRPAGQGPQESVLTSVLTSAQTNVLTNVQTQSEGATNEIGSRASQCEERKRWVIARIPRVVAVFTSSGVLLLVCFQNFNAIPIDNLRIEVSSAHASSPTDGTADIRDLAPMQMKIPSDSIQIAAPQSGGDLGSISSDWAGRQAHLITGGADERFIADVNKKMDRFWRETFMSDKVETAEDADADDANITDDVAEADKKPERMTSVPVIKTRAPAAVPDDDSAYYGMKPKSLRFMSVNRFQLDLANHTKVSCSFGGTLAVELSHPIAEGMDLMLHHEPSSAKSTVSFNYKW